MPKLRTLAPLIRYINTRTADCHQGRWTQSTAHASSRLACHSRRACRVQVRGYRPWPQVHQGKA